jgi:S1-C subfamily serine protease
MATQSDILGQISNALAERTVTAGGEVAAIKIAGRRHQTATVWRPDLLITSEQSLAKGDAFETVLAGGIAATARLVGRDAGTNVAVLRLAQPSVSNISGNVTARTGALAFAFGADGSGGATARLGLVNFVGPQWHSRGGGKISARVLLDIRLAPWEEGGPVFDAEGGRIGISTFGPRGRVLAIPAETIESVVAVILQHGRVARGWLGAAFRPVAVPDALQAQTGQAAGLIVLSVSPGGPAAKAGVMPGDILLAIDKTPAMRVRQVIPRLDADSVGKTVNLEILRGGALVAIQTVIEARPAA